MQIYNILGCVDSYKTPLAVYTDDDRMEARFCDEIRQFTSGYKCMRESYNELDKIIYIDYEQKRTVTVNDKLEVITSRKTVEIHIMELRGVVEKEQQNG